MPVSAATLKLLMDAGVTGDALVAIVASIDDDCRVEVGWKSGGQSDAHERRKAWDREYRAKRRAEKSGGNRVDESPPKERPPIPPKEITPPVPSEPNFSSKRKTARSAEPEGFAEWYGGYPRKVGRFDAAKAYGKAAKEVPRDRLLETRDLYAARMAGRDPEYIKHPATWLNKRCWEDEEANRNGGRTDIEAQLAILHAPSA